MKKILSLLLSLSLLFALCACSENTASAKPYFSFTDDVGHEILLYSKPQRVAILFSSLAEVWKLSGGDVDITVGESTERGFADDTAILVDNGAGKTINTELLISASPDLVICSADISAQLEVAELMKSIGIPSACLRIEAFEEYLNVLSLFCEINENRTAYEKYGTEVVTRVTAQRSKPFIGEKSYDALFIRAGASTSSVKAKQSRDHFAAAMISELGVINIADEVPILIDSLSIEEILLRDPDYIFISTMGDEKAAMENIEQMFLRPEWQTLSAIRNKSYAFLPKELFHYKPNAHWDEAYKFLVDFIYDYE